MLGHVIIAWQHCHCHIHLLNCCFHWPYCSYGNWIPGRLTYTKWLPHSHSCHCNGCYGYYPVAMLTFNHIVAMVTDPLNSFYHWNWLLGLLPCYPVARVPFYLVYMVVDYPNSPSCHALYLVAKVAIDCHGYYPVAMLTFYHVAWVTITLFMPL